MRTIALSLLAGLLLLAGCSEDPRTGQGPVIDPESGAVVINEVNAAADYIELYNPTAAPYDLSGMRFRKNRTDFLLDADRTGDFVVPQGTLLGAKGYAVLGCKGSGVESPGLSLGVSATGISGSKSLLLELVDKAGRRVDYFVNSAFEHPRAADAWDAAVEQTFDVAARHADGGKWHVVASATPGRSNDPTAKGAPFTHTEVDFTAKEPNPVPKPDIADGLAYVFDMTALPEVHVEVPLAEWNKLLASYDADPNTDAYVACDVSFVKSGRTHRIEQAGLRLRGNTSRRRPEGGTGEMHRPDGADWRHCHFMLNLRKFVKDDAHTLGGVRKIHLKWFKDDPAYVREIYCYDLFRRYGIPTAVNSSYGRLWIKVAGDSRETYYGVYEMLEAVDEEYLKARKECFGNAAHNLWKCAYGADLAATDADRFRPDEQTGTQSYPYVLKTNTADFAAAREQLIDFILKLNGKTGESFRTWIEQVTDVELLLKTYAVNVAVGMWDDYWCNQNNYYLYFNSSDKYDYRFFFIPYDYDNTLGTSSIIDSGRQDPLNWGDNGRRLIRKLLDFPDYRAVYLRALRELCAGEDLFRMDGSIARIRAWQSMIAPHVANDTGEDMSVGDRPASWGNRPEYRLTDTGENNFFRVKASSIPAN